MPPDNNDSGKHDRSFGNRDYSYGYNSSSNNTRRYYSQSNQPNICYLLCCNSRTLIFFIYLVSCNLPLLPASVFNKLLK